jgi:hypothetical protein
VEKAILEAATHPVVLLGGANLIGMTLEGKTAPIAVIPIGTAVTFEITVMIIGPMFEITVGGTELEESRFDLSML